MPKQQKELKWDKPVKTLEQALSKLNKGAKTLQFQHRTDPYGDVPTSFSHEDLEGYIANPQIGKRGAKDIFKALETNDTCVALDLSGNRIEGKNAMKALCDMLKVNKTLRILYLENNRINDGNCKKLGEALRGNSVLEELCLSSNLITDAGAKHLASGLSRNRSLKALWLNNQQGEGLRDAGAKALARALRKRHKSCDDFLLGYGENHMRERGFKRLATAAGNNKITTLYVPQNKIGAKGAKYAKKAVKKTVKKHHGDGKERKWYLEGNRMNDDDLEKLEALGVGDIKMYGSNPAHHEKGSVIERTSAYVKYHILGSPFYWGKGHFKEDEEIERVL